MLSMNDNEVFQLNYNKSQKLNTNAIANLMRRLNLEIQIVFEDLKIYQLRAVRI